MPRILLYWGLRQRGRHKRRTPRIFAYTEAGYRQKDADIDGALVDTFAREIMWRRNSVGPMVFGFL